MNMLSTIGRGLRLLLVPLALAGLAACASPFRADVSRFASQLPAPAGQTFTVVASDPAMAGGLEFATYAQHVADRMAALGYAVTASATPKTSTKKRATTCFST